MGYSKILSAQSARLDFYLAQLIVDHYKITHDWILDLRVLVSKYGVVGMMLMLFTLILQIKNLSPIFVA